MQFAKLTKLEVKELMKWLRENYMSVYDKLVKWLKEESEQGSSVEINMELNTRRLEILLWLTLLFNIGTGVLVVLFYLWIL